mgnify:CR=1 FL=1
MYFFNTMGRKKEEFIPIDKKETKLYTCGPTVYNYAHIGNLRTYIFEDILRRTLEYFGYKVKHAMNITDVGHLESNADVGEDKMINAAKRENKSPVEIARFYEKAFFSDCKDLNILPPHIACRATENINTMIQFIQKIEKNGYAYISEGNVYFDISKFPDYGKLVLMPLKKLRAGARVNIDKAKRNPLDFALWFSRSKFPHQIMQWDSPWGRGFPGWHVECSTMATKYLGEIIDIHCGGVDHIPIHHTNEIAQSEAALGHKWVNIWMHGEFLIFKKGKMAKSTGSFITLHTLKNKGYNPLHYRFLCLAAHYRSPLSFDWESLDAARCGFENLKNLILEWKEELYSHSVNKIKDYLESFENAMADDLDTPVALSILWKSAKDKDLGTIEKLELIERFDQVMGLGIENFTKQKLSDEMMQLIEEREKARKNRNWQVADRIREKLIKKGIILKDTRYGIRWYSKK